jgi:hypothetical protein
MDSTPIFVKTLAKSKPELLFVPNEFLVFNDSCKLLYIDKLSRFVDNQFDGKWDSYKVIDTESRCVQKVYHKFDRARD